MTPDDIRAEIELKIVEFLKQALTDGTLSEERSQQISQRVLEVLRPGMNMEELYRAIPKLDDTCPELSPIIIPYLREYEENIAKSAQKNVSELIRLGQYDAAIKVANKAINQDVNLVWQGKGQASQNSNVKSQS